MKVRRSSFLTLVAIACTTGPAWAALSPKAKFISSCDETISIARLAGAPYKFVGKHVDLHGTVGGPADDGTAFNLADNNGNVIVARHDARQLEAGQAVRVLGIVTRPSEYSLVSGGAMTAAVVNVKYME